MPSSRSGFAPVPSATASSMAATFPRTNRAVSSRAAPSSASALARRRCDRTSPSIREDATDSDRSRRRARTSRLASQGGSRFNASTARSAADTEAATSEGTESCSFAIGSGTNARYRKDIRSGLPPGTAGSAGQERVSKRLIGKETSPRAIVSQGLAENMDQGQAIVKVSRWLRRLHLAALVRPTGWPAMVPIGKPEAAGARRGRGISTTCAAANPGSRTPGLRTPVRDAKFTKSNTPASQPPAGLHFLCAPCWS